MGPRTQPPLSQLGFFLKPQFGEFLYCGWGGEDLGVVMTRLDPSRDREKSEYGFRNLRCWLGFWGECDETLQRQHTHLWGQDFSG